MLLPHPPHPLKAHILGKAAHCLEPEVFGIETPVAQLLPLSIDHEQSNPPTEEARQIANMMEERMATFLLPQEHKISSSIAKMHF